MKKKKVIYYVVGARPQFIQAAAIRRAFLKIEGIDFRIIHAGQHFDRNMSDIFFEQLEIPAPHKNLGVNSLSHGAMVGRTMERLEALAVAEKPDMLMIDGDTNTTLAGALVAAKLRIASAHVESGLRSFDMRMPEEINRVIADNCCSRLYCPTSAAFDNLRKAGLDRKAIIVGDVLYDSFCFYSPLARDKSAAILRNRGLVSGQYALVTIHREENLEDKEKIQAFFESISGIEYPALFPVHPRTAKILHEYNIDLKKASNVHAIEPVGYLEMLDLEAQSVYIITDSGGLQREAYWSRKPLFILRDTTEWVEQLGTGWAMLIVKDKLKDIQTHIRHLRENLREDHHRDFYGDGSAAVKIAQDIAVNFL